MTRCNCCTECGWSSKDAGFKQTEQWCRRCGSQWSSDAEPAREHGWNRSFMADTKRERVFAMRADLPALLALAGLAFAF